MVNKEMIIKVINECKNDYYIMKGILSDDAKEYLKSNNIRYVNEYFFRSNTIWLFNI